VSFLGGLATSARRCPAAAAPTTTPSTPEPEYQIPGGKSTLLKRYEGAYWIV